MTTLPPDLTSHVRLLFSSFQKVTGRSLDEAWDSLSDESLVDAFETAPRVIASHGTEEDPILNYGNRAALDLWEATREEFTALPSRQTAEPVERTERERLLREVTENGFIDDYSGVRISTKGKRFLIKRATVWNLIDEKGEYRGQAVVFSDWEAL